MRIPIADITKNEGKEVELAGWVHARRDHGKLIFIDIRDRSGLAQVVFGPETPAASDLRLEYVIKMTGLVKKRPPKMVNEKLPTGAYEIEGKSLEVLNEVRMDYNVSYMTSVKGLKELVATDKFNSLPIPVAGSDGYEIDEETRIKYRYIDLRRERLAKNMQLRSRIIKFIRDFLGERGFLEIETPILSKSTPEGARDYLVPSRIQKGNFYALPQSPQQYKQLLMVAGLEKYFQIARCFRDEDTRGDRQPEFTQLDLEMSFVEREDVMRINEELLIALVKAIAPEKKMQEVPFPRLGYKEAMEKYGTDRPDLRKDKEDKDLLAFCWVIDFPFFEKSPDSPSGWTFTHNPFSAPQGAESYDLYDKYLTSQGKLTDAEFASIKTAQYDIALNGLEVGGGSIRAHNPLTLITTFQILGYPKEKIMAQFGHMIQALQSGAPPHGGIAWGLDRLVSLLANEPNIREVIAFPKTGDGRDPMMGSPSEADPKQIKELGLEIKK